jgi:transposase
VKRSHYQIVWLLSQGKLTREVTEATGYKAEWIRRIAGRYNQLGEEGLGDRRRRNPGAKGRALLGPRLREELGEALSSPPADGGMWNSRKVAEWIAERVGREVGVQRGWEYLRLLGYTPQVPRPTHARADTAEQEEFRGNSRGG